MVDSTNDDEAANIKRSAAAHNAIVDAYHNDVFAEETKTISAEEKHVMLLALWRHQRSVQDSSSIINQEKML